MSSLKLFVIFLLLASLVSISTAGEVIPAKKLFRHTDDVFQTPPPKGLSKLAAAPATGSRQIITLLAEFADKNHSTTGCGGECSSSYFSNLLFGSANNTLRAYYYENSYGQLNVSGSVTGWFGLSRNLAYYGFDNGQAIDYGQGPVNYGPCDLLNDTVRAADSTVDFSCYPTCTILVLHAGNGQESSSVSTDIWSSSWNCALATPGFAIPVDSVNITSAIFAPETEVSASPFGVIAHEYAHALGAPDLYNTTSGNYVVYYWDLMDAGAWSGSPPGSNPSHLSAWNKILLGWVTPQTVDYLIATSLNLSSLESSASVLKLPLLNSSNEYFLVENRQKTTGYFDAAVPEAGVLIWHVDDSIGSIGSNNINNFAVPRLIPENQNSSVASLAAAAFTSGQSFTPSTSPNSATNTGQSTGISVSNLNLTGTTYGLTASNNDTIGPSVVLTDDHPDSYIRDADSILLTATFTDASAIDETAGVNISIDYPTNCTDVSNASMTKSSNKIWNNTIDVPATCDGTATLSLSAIDVAANPNQQPTGQTSYVVDNTGPSGNSTTPATQRNTIYLNGTATDALSGVVNVSITASNATGGVSDWTAISGTTTWFASNATTIPDGFYYATIRVTDAAGNIFDFNATTRVDNTPPTGSSTTTAIQQGTIYMNGTSADSGSGVSSVTLTASNTTGGLSAWSSVSGTTVWFATNSTTIPDGFYYATIRVTDAANNTYEFNTTTQVRNTAPTVSITYNSTAPSFKSGQLLKITATFSSGQIEETFPPRINITTAGDGDAAANMTKTNNTVWYYDFATPTGADEDGNFTVSITATDTLNNTITATDSTKSIDNISPTILNVTSSTPDGSYKAGQLINISILFSEPVTVFGTPIVFLNATAIESAVYFSGNATSILYFNYTVQSGDTAADLDYTNTSALAGTITDTATNSANLTLPAGLLALNKNLIIDTTSPTILNVTSPNPNGYYAAGTSINITITFTEPVYVIGTPTLELETGATDRNATYSVGNGTIYLNFTYTVQTNDTSPDLNYTGPNALVGTIADAATNSANLTLLQSLAANRDLVIDAISPVISAIRVTDVSADSAIVKWTTDEAATSVVYYGLTSSFGSTATSANGTSHSVSLTNLTNSTSYFFKVSSSDAAGNTANGTGYNFTTAASYVNNSVTAPANTTTLFNSTLLNATIELTTNLTISGSLSITQNTETPVNKTLADDNNSTIPLSYLDINSTLNSTSFPSVLITLLYSDNQLSSLGIEETSLALYWFNETTSSWIPLNTSLAFVLATGQNTTANSIWANVTHFSSYGLAGKKANGLACSTASQCSSSSCVHGTCRADSYYSGDGFCDSGETCSNSVDCGSCQVTYSTGGGGGGGLVQVISEAQTITTLAAGESTTLSFAKAAEIAISKIQIEALNTISSAQVTIQQLTARPSSIKAAPVESTAGNVYLYLSLSKTINDVDIAKIKMTFNVNKTWLSTNSIDASTVKLYRYASSQWNALETTKLSETSSEVTYEAITPGFSTFAIAGEKTTTSVQPVTQSKTPFQKILDLIDSYYSNKGSLTIWELIGKIDDYFGGRLA